ncbi:HutD family protein [Luteimonas sp. 3794]|uniref:HutD/Ves family protein n=1 Tax=Luteimonas sp. 3794 TaxID=2817730 RepID=UPI00286517F5|nr:HutD family protein [Luteimonas sp. 3794]MDR6992998.1 environmental stress-induced protein Ves [Luteimonas sp. 3794]
MSAQSSGQFSSIQRIDAHEARRLRWRNDLGWTREIHAEPGAEAGVWTWRLSIAKIEQPAAFSRFEGVERELMLLAGDGLTLRFDDGQVSDLQPPHARLRFAGERALRGEPAGPAVSALNLMWHPGDVVASTWHRPLVGTMVVFVDPGDCWMVHLLAGQARLAGMHMRPLERGDTLLLRAPGGRCRHVLDGGGEVLLARFQRAAPAA